MGRGPGVTDAERQYMIELRQQGKTQDEIASITGRSRSAVRYTLIPRRREKEKDRLRPSTRKAREVDHEYTVSNSIPLDIKLRDGSSGYVYRLWSGKARCLYIGQTIQCNPINRVIYHKNKPWWDEVAYADYVVVYGSLNDAEFSQVQELQPLYNTYHQLRP